jgi:hypothetical protein
MVYASKWFTPRFPPRLRVPPQLLRSCGSSGARDRGPRLALRPTHGPLGCRSSGLLALLALLARLPLGRHVALDLSPIDLRRWPLFGHPLHAKVEEAPLPGRPVGPFPAVSEWFYRPELEFLRLRISLTLRPRINYLGVKVFGALR